ncbi:MAG: ATP-binding protein [Vicinamibacterales bacterium]
MQPLTSVSYALLGLMVVGGLLLLALVVTIVRFAGARHSSRHNERTGEVATLSVALQEAVSKLRAQERAMAARAEASERLSGQIIEGLTSGLVVVDRAGLVQTMNPAAMRILNFQDSVPGVPFREALASAPALADLIGEALQSSSPIVRRTVEAHPGRTAHLGVTVSPILDANQEIQAAVCLFTDLTAVMDLEEQLRLKEALARLGELTAGLAHEFRNGLATIHGYGRLLDPAELPAAQRPYVEGIRAETIALGEVVTNFLRFAKPDPLALTPTDLRAVIERAVDDLRPPPSSTRLAGVFGTIDGDDVLLRQVFSNLLRNSLEACAIARIEPQIVVTGAVDGGEIHVTVDDNGPGVSPAAFARLFQPFATTKSTGTGLGLAIVQKVIVSHNGRITASNRTAGGAQFRIRLPLSSGS